ncbi:hypothetical protein [Daejeonella sp.]|uniref:hypothetical protein n=1 Tax=Daejeonella sp. TaxID=2805397 RepID=UPI0025B8F727|nr:hypothetical protein [Daejeonella sp.]
MLDKNSCFDPSQIRLKEFKLLKEQIEIPQDFDSIQVEGFHLDNGLQLGFNLEEHLVKADFKVKINTKGQGHNQDESYANFHLIFIFRIDNLEDFAKPNKNNLIELHPDLANALASITYSTSRGVLLTKLQGTALGNFILPVINPNDLISDQ